MKISDALRTKIADEYTAAQYFVPDTKLPEFPSAETILEVILASSPYMATDKTKWAGLEQTNEIWDDINSELIELPRKIPLMRRGVIAITKDLRLNGGDQLHISASSHSDYVRHYNELRNLKSQCRNGVLETVRLSDTLQQLIKNKKKFGELECVKAALAHEKAVRAAAKERKKNEVLEPIVIEDAATTAIAKARLLGAKFLS